MILMPLQTAQYQGGVLIVDSLVHENDHDQQSMNELLDPGFIKYPNADQH